MKVKPSHYERTKYCNRDCLSAAKTIIVTCLICGKDVTHKAYYKGKKKYCSKNCYMQVLRNKNKKIKRECAQCHKIIFVSSSRNGNNICCSMHCRREFGLTKYYIKICQRCGNEYKSYNRDAPNSKYCSKECYHLAHTVKKYCEYCGTEFEIKASGASKRIFCSKECANGDYRIRYADMTYDRKDNNHDEIVDALKGVGAKVASLTSIKYGCPDILIGWKGRLMFAEIKSKKGKLSPAQIRFFEEWGDSVTILRSVDDALILLRDWK